MQKSGYVNNLGDMREQLRRNYRNPGDVTAPAENMLSDVPQGKVNRFDVEAQRDARDLEGRLLSALATAENHGALLDFRRNELNARIEKLRALMAELETIHHAEPAEYRSKVDHLRYRFFEIDVEERELAAPAAAEAPENHSLLSAWIIAGAILLGSLIAAGAFFFSF